MKIRFYWLITVFSLLLSHPVFSQQMISSIDRQSIELNDTFWLTVTTDLQTVDEMPDFSELETQFDVLSTQQRRQYQLVNGRTSSTREWRLLLAPKEVGTLIIPSFRLAGLYSEAIVIDVSPPSQKTAFNDIFLESSIDRKTAYVQQQVLLTLRLLTRVSLAGVQQVDFTIDGTITELLSEKQYDRRIDNQRYAVLEKTYGIFPQTSGSLIIPSVRWQAEKASQSLAFSLDPFDRLRKLNRSVVRLDSEPHVVSVLPVPDSYRGQHWLPATRLTIEEEWNGKKEWHGDALKATVGEPITRTITLRGEGVSGAQIPPLPAFENNDFNIYPNLPKIETEKTRLGLTGVRTERYSIVPVNVGSFRLPKITVHWWDTEANEEKVSVLPEKVLFVEGAASGTNSQNSTSSLSGFIENTDDELPATSTASSSSPSATLTKPLFSKIEQIGVLIFALATLCFFILWFMLWRRNRQKENTNTKLIAKTRISERQAFQQLSSALLTSNLSLIRQRLITWSQIYFNNESITQLSDVTNHLPNAASDIINALDQQLYGRENNNKHDDQWQPKALLACIQQQRKIKMKAPTVNQPSLKPLYP